MIKYGVSSVFFFVKKLYKRNEDDNFKCLDFFFMMCYNYYIIYMISKGIITYFFGFKGVSKCIMWVTK